MSALDDSAVPEPDVLDTGRAGPLALRGSLLRLGGYGGGMLLALIAQPLVARHLHRIGYGRYTLAITIATIATGLTEGGVNMVALREYATQAGSVRRLALANILGIRTLLSAASLAGAVGFAAVAGYPAAVVIATALATLGLTTQVTQGVLAVPLQGELRFGWVAVADLVRQAVATLLVVALVIAGASVAALVAVLIPASLAALVLTVRLVRRTMPLWPRFDLRISAPLLRDTLPFAVAVALSVTYFRLTVVLVSLIAGGSQLGIFSYSYRVVEVLIGLPALVVGAAYPILTRAARDDPERFVYTVGRIFELAVIVAAWLAVCLELSAGFVVDVIGGHAASPAAAVLRIQGLAVIGTFVAAALAFPLLAVRGYRATMYANGSGLLATVVLGLALIPSLGARGGALATVGGELALVVANAVALPRARPGLRLPLGVLPTAALAGSAAIALGHVVGVHAVVQVLVATAAYGVMLALLGRFPPEVGHALRPHRVTHQPPAPEPPA